MHAEFRRISFVSMSNSGLFIVKDDEEEGTEFQILKRQPLDFQEECQGTATFSSHNDQELEELEDHEKKGEENNVKAASKESEKKMMMTMVSLGELKAADDDDDGFKTPTSLDHKIPAIKQCPPAPRKPKPIPSNKRKASPSNSSSASTRRNTQLSVAQEVESLFPSALLADIHHRKVKKARTQDQNQ